MARRSYKFVAIVIPLLVVAAGIAVGDELPASQPVSAGRITGDASWALQVPKDDKVVFHGVANFDSAGVHTGAVMYPAPNAAVALAALLTHGILNESAKKAQKNHLQEAADKILAPYQPVLGGYQYRELLQRGLEKFPGGRGGKLVDTADKAASDWLIVCAPIFSITQDQRSVVLDNYVSVYAPGSLSNAAYQNTFRIVSRPRDETDLVQFWTANAGEKLKDESAVLLAESLRLVLSDAAGGLVKGDEPSRTVRYMLGDKEMMERGQVIGDHCGRVTIKTLRGGFMSVPPGQTAASSSSADQCADASTLLK